VLAQVDGIWKTLSADRRAVFSGFLRDYEDIRQREGRGSAQGAFYLALPYADLTGNFRDQWHIRGRSYRFFEQRLLPKLEKRHGSNFRALDIGAGNGWLSFRLALQGHRPFAIDLCCNAWDGLGAASHYEQVLPEMFPRFEAEMDALPFEDAQFDVAIFNASFHYSTNYTRTLRETLRCLKPGGTILILDSPTYKQAHSGEAMRLERQVHFEARFGTRSDALPTSDFLTPEILDVLGGLGVRWQRHLAWYGMRWWMRPWVARVKRRREPSQFYLYEGQTEQA
jgi:SAM-dependent methyltransferase